MGNLGYVVVIILLSIIASLSLTALWVAGRRLDEAEERIAELDMRVSTLQGELLAHTHVDHKELPTIPQSYPMIRYTWERRKRVRWH